MQDDIKDIFLSKYAKAGKERFYDFLIAYALNRVANLADIKGLTPELELIGYYEQFLSLFREENVPLYLDIARVFRRAGHTVYLTMLKQQITKRNDKFLNTVE